MLKTLLFIFLLILALPALARSAAVIGDGVYLTYGANGIQLFENKKEFKREGLLLEYFENGEVAKMFQYHADRLQGFAVSYYPNQQIQYRIHFVDGIRHGPAERFNENGSLALELTYRDGKPDGIAKIYDSNGVLEQLALYSWGKLVRIADCDPDGNINNIRENH